MNATARLVPGQLHIENQLTEGMTWDNYGNGEGKWNLDHIIPLSKAYLDGPDAFAAACKFTNIRPMWAVDNVKKGNK